MSMTGQTRVERDRALLQVEEHSEPEWVALAEYCVASLAAHREVFSSDDVWDMLASLAAPVPHEPRALGPVMLRMARGKLIEPVGYATSRRRHGGTVRLYRRNK